MRKTTAFCLVVFAHVAVSPDVSSQTPRELAGYLPANTPVLVDLVDAPACVQNALSLLDPLPRDLPPGVRVFLMGLPFLSKAATGMDIADLLGVLAPSQAAFAMFPGVAGKPPFPVILTRVTEGAEAHRVLQRIARQVGADRLHTSIDDGVLTLTGNAANLAAVLRFRRAQAPTLFADVAYRRHRVASRPGRSIRFHVNIGMIRQLATARTGNAGHETSHYWEGLDDGARFLLGPLVRTLDVASRIDGRLDITGAGLKLHGSADADLRSDSIDVGRLLAAGAEGRQLRPFPAGTLACVALDRDVSELLNHPDRWLGDDGALGVKNFLSVADQILGGASLLRDLLPNIEMPLDLFVTATDRDPDGENPRIHLPAFTLVFGLGEEAKKVQNLLTRSMSTITAIANVQRVRDKKTSISVRGDRRDGYRFQRIRFGDWNGDGDPPTEQGLSPTLLFAHGHGILASTADGALRMANALKSESGRRIRGDYLTLLGTGIADLIEANMSVLTIDRVLKEGETRQQARAVLAGIESVVRVFELEASVSPHSDKQSSSASSDRPREAPATRFALELRRIR